MIRNPKKIFCIILILLGTSVLKLNGQTTGSLFMLQDNFHSQMINPSFMRGDDAIVFAIPGLAGGTVGNSGNFKFTDVIREQPDGEMAIDIEHFYNQGIATTRLADWSSIPYIFVSVPTEEGRLSFYLKEQVVTSFQFQTEAIQFFNNGNQLEKYKSFKTDDAQISASAYRELGIGYAVEKTDDLSIGIRGKLLFGVVMVDLRDWEYGIETSDNSESVELISTGRGRLSLPFEVGLRYGKIRSINTDAAFSKYIKSFNNPGLALDLGINYRLDDDKQIAVSFTDIGAIWFHMNSYAIDQNSRYDFTGFDLSNSLDKNSTADYIDSYDLVLNTKDSIRNVFRLDADTANFLKSLPPKTVLHYNYEKNENLVFGITNQTIFLRKNIQNKLSLNAKQKIGALSIFENINFHNVNNVSFGAGLQLDIPFAQLFFATDNILAFYHPANQKSFTVSFGLSFLLEKKQKKSKYKKGTFLPWRPFYEIKKG